MANNSVYLLKSIKMGLRILEPPAEPYLRNSFVVVGNFVACYRLFVILLDFTLIAIKQLLFSFNNSSIERSLVRGSRH
jgi:hypothetical protein